MRAIAILVLAVWSLWLSGEPAAAEKRVALVIGNSSYQHAIKLGNPVNDSDSVAATLKAAGFDTVETRHDLGIAGMRKALRDFTDKTVNADIAVVFYAGHGIELDGTNYLIPVDAALKRDIDVYDEAISLDRILATIEPARQLRLVILDACRNNPFADTMKRTVGTRAIGRGLAKVEPNSPNTMIAFAARAGSTALDGDSKHSPFTASLVRHIATPGLDLRRAFGYVRDDVLKSTGNRQEPLVYGSLGGDDVPLVPGKEVAAAAASDPTATIRRDYELALQIGNRAAWTIFLEQYREGFYAKLAQVQLAKIAADEARVAATAKA
ncbi:caspase family protein [Bradyrhizobium sp.]|uniref:caspase family protein n=1 Tax=Bradyrhizobium sp. TaxID=376 RepID=UPI003D0DC388